MAPAGAWLIEEGYLKPFAAVRHVHYGAAAALEWRRRMAGEVGGVAAGTIEAITLSIYEEGRTYCGNRAPVTAIDHDRG